jgi:hypothetical protein
MSEECSTYRERTGVYTVLVGKPDGRRPRGRWEDYMKMDL